MESERLRRVLAQTLMGLENFVQFGLNAGIPMNHIGEMAELYLRLDAANECDKDPVEGVILANAQVNKLLRRLSVLESKYDLADYDKPLPGEKTHLGYDAGLEAVKDLIKSGTRFIYITGKSATGKSVFINDLNASGFLSKNARVNDDGEITGKGEQTLYGTCFVTREELKKEPGKIAYISCPHEIWIDQFLRNRDHGACATADFNTDLISKINRPTDFQKVFCDLIIDNYKE